MKNELTLEKLFNERRCHVNDSGVITKEIDNINNVIKLDLDDLDLDSIPELINNFHNLETISLSNNQITNIDNLNYILNKEKIKSINLSNNNINNIDYLINFPNLQQINASNNHLKDFSILKNLSKLDYLMLSDNKISKLPEILLEMNLFYLDISNNQITTIENFPLDEKGKTFKRVKFYGNPLKYNIYKKFIFNNNIDNPLTNKIAPKEIRNEEEKQLYKELYNNYIEFRKEIEKLNEFKDFKKNKDFLKDNDIENINFGF